MQQTESLIDRLASRMRTAQECGDLSYFNQAYRVYRIDRVARGEPAMSYSAARSRLKRTLVEVAAGKAAPGAIVTRIFDTR